MISKEMSADGNGRQRLEMVGNDWRVLESDWKECGGTGENG
jgi:hypothetical protein